MGINPAPTLYHEKSFTHMMKFLEPNEVSEFCTLVEALEWVICKEYPVARLDDHWDRFVEPNTPLRMPEETEVDKEFTKFFEDSKGDGGCFDSDKYKELTEKKNKENAMMAAEYESETETAKHDLFLALKKGTVSAYGIFYDKMKPGYSLPQWNDDDAWESLNSDEHSYVRKVYDLYSEDMFLDEQKVQRIPASCWRFEGIEWIGGKIRSPEGRYLFVHFDFNELIEVFEESEPEFITIERRNGWLFYDDEADKIEEKSNLKKLGRKPVVDWDAVHAHIAHDIMLTGGKLSKQDAYAQDIKGWVFPKEQIQHDEYQQFIGGVALSRNHIKSHEPVARIIKRVFENAGLKYNNPHSFRDMQTHHFVNNYGLPEIAALSLNLGHENIAITLGNYYKPTPVQQFDILEKIGKPKESVGSDTKEILAQMKQMKELLLNKGGSYNSST